jgi:hypothetical protein
MIKADGSNSCVELKGVAVTLMAEYAMLTKSLIDTVAEVGSRDVAIKMITKAFEMGRDKEND